MSVEVVIVIHPFQSGIKTSIRKGKRNKRERKKNHG